MDNKIVIDKQDLRYLKWSHARNSSGTAGTFLKSQETINGHKIYYKLSNFDSVNGIIGHECINEIIVDRLLDILGVDHLSYKLIFADIEIEGKIYDTWLCASEDFKEKGESKMALDNYYQINSDPGVSHYDFCKTMGWQKYIDTMLAIDYLILNRDRHGANIEVLMNPRKHTLRLAPLFDHGLSFLCSCFTEEAREAFDVMADKPCQNFIGSRSVQQNLNLINNKRELFTNQLKDTDKDTLFMNLDKAISKSHIDKIWEMLSRRWDHYESICNL